MSSTTATGKTITIETNFNQKMGCDHFIHIDLAPRQGVTERVARETPIQIRTADNSAPPVTVYLVDLARTTVCRLNTLVTFVSHGLSCKDFTTFLVTKYGDGIGPLTELAVYFYSKNPR